MKIVEPQDAAGNFVQLTRHWAAVKSEATAYTFLVDGENEEAVFSYADLDRRARAIAAVLQKNGLVGERALLLYPPGLDYIAAFIGCLYAGVIAVPAYPPNPAQGERGLDRLASIVKDCGARAALATSVVVEIAKSMTESFREFRDLSWLATDDIPEKAEEDWKEPGILPDDLAFLQYTSGSTSEPKGVMVSHGNLVANERLAQIAYETDSRIVCVNWLPPYHDMGLIGAILHGLFLGGTSVLMSPLDFLKKPLRWMQALSRYRATITGGPNFAYDLCVRKISPEERDQLDLSSLVTVINGAEPVRLDVMERFADYFRPAGFRPEAFHPSYGLAEATLIVSGGGNREPAKSLSVRKDGLIRQRVVPASPGDEGVATHVGCGHTLGGQEILIVEPETRRKCSPGAIGEIWVKGPCVAKGYWNKPALSEEVFRATLQDDGDGTFLRTGDLGFLHNGELYITGRRKDLIIIRGQNHLPQDLEWTVENAVPGIRPGCGAAFSVEVNGEERLVLVHEIERRHHDRRRRAPEHPDAAERRTSSDRRWQALTPGNEPRQPQAFDADQTVRRIREAILEKHRLQVHSVQLIKPGSIPKTSSGKIRRSACKALFLEGGLEVIAGWREEAPAKEGVTGEPAGRPTLDELKSWFRGKMEERLGKPAKQMDLDAPLHSFGFDSLEALSMLGELESKLGRTLSAELLDRFPTLGALLEHLAGESKPSAPPSKEEDGPSADSAYARYVNPFIAGRLGEIKLDKEYVRGEGCRLYDRQGRAYLDFLASYGALPFGFNPPEIWEAIREVERDLEPSMAQPSLLRGAGDLGRGLIEATGGRFDIAVFTNSGAEATEAALKLALAATGRRKILSTENSFHGKTLAALSATNRPVYQRPFGAPLAGFEKIPFGDAEALEAAFENGAKDYAAFIVEPIQGEGGVRVPPDGYLRKVRKLCARYGVPFLLDEVQTGLGRTGRLFAYEEEGAEPDILILAKALGGGLVPIGAVLCKREFYSEDFALHHSSTFAGNTLACRVGLKSLEMLTRDGQALVRHVREMGEYLREGLEELRRLYPRWIREIRGKGYLLGVEFERGRDVIGWNSALGVLAEQGKLAAMVASFLLNVHGIRVATMLNDSSVLRIEPPLIAGREECSQLLSALRSALEHLESRHYKSLFAHFLEAPAGNRAAPRRRGGSPGPRDGRWAFICHMLGEEDLVRMDAEFSVFRRRERSSLSKVFGGMVEPFVAGTTVIESLKQKRAYGEFILVPRTTQALVDMPRPQAIKEIRAAVDLAKSRGAQIVGLGAFSSILTGNGHDLRLADVPMTSGNHYTVVSGIHAVHHALSVLGPNGHGRTLAVLGSGGSIGRMISILLADRFSRVILVGNPRHGAESLAGLERVAQEIRRHLAPEGFLAEGSIVLTTDAGRWLPEADVVVTATSSPDSWIGSKHLKEGAVVCEISRPGNVTDEVRRHRKDVTVLEGGVVEVPNRQDLGADFGLDPGLAYACMAETMIWGLEQKYRNFGIGQPLQLETIRELMELSQEHGFRTNHRLMGAA